MALGAGADVASDLPVSPVPLVSFGARTNATAGALAVVCDRRAAFAWRVAVDFFAMPLVSPVSCYELVEHANDIMRAIMGSIAYRDGGRKRDRISYHAGASRPHIYNG